MKKIDYKQSDVKKDKFVISGGKVFDGKIRAESAKNAVLPILAGATLLSGETVINDCPEISDVENMADILSDLQCKVKREGKNFIVNSDCQFEKDLPFFLTEKMRSSVFMLGALLSKFKRAKISYPGGCRIGKRPVDIHIKSLKELGVTVRETEEFIECDARNFKGGETVLAYPSVGATENIILSSVLSDAVTVIKNSAKEPEIADLANFLNRAGAKIYGAGTSTITINGVKRLSGISYKPIPDRIEAGTYLIATALTGGKAEIENVKAENISSLINKLCDYTCKVLVKDDIIYIKSGGKGKPFCFETGPYPAFPTDLQAPLFTLALKADGVSVIKETVFENRFSHALQFKNAGADVIVKGNVCRVRGGKPLFAADFCAKDLRGGAALVLYGLYAKGVTTVRDVFHIDRGYAEMEKKLNALGGYVQRIRE